MHYKPAVNRKAQTSRHILVQTDENKRLAQDWRDEFQISEPYTAYSDKCIDKLTELQSIWDGHLGRISVAKDRIKRLDVSTQPVLSAPYRAEPITREVVKIKIEKMLKENITMPAQT